MRWPPSHIGLLTLALLAILIATLWPLPGQEPAGWIACIACGDRATSDILVNVLLFAPLGAVLALHVTGIPRCALIAGLLSGTIELAQLYIIPGRDSSIGDVLANVLGATLGAVLARTAPAWLLPPPARATRFARAAAVAAAAVCGATGLLLAPAFPDTSYYAMWTPSLAHLEVYRGRVLEATLAGAPVTPGAVPDSRLVRERLASPRAFALHVRALAGPQPPALAPLFAIYDAAQREILLLGPDRADLVFRVRARTAPLGLDQPDIRFRRALQLIRPGDTLDITISGGSEHGDYHITLDGRTGPDSGCGVGCGWAVLWYSEALPGWLGIALGAAWVGGLFVPAGFWARTRGDLVFVAAAAAAALAGAPAVTPLGATPLLHWLAAALGAIGGTALRLQLSRRPGLRRGDAAP